MRTALRLGTACLGVAAILAVATAFTSSPVAASRTSGECTEANARQLIAEHDLNDFLLPNPVLQLLCGPFTGPGSQAMAVVIGPLPTCWITSGWVVFSFTAESGSSSSTRGCASSHPLWRHGSGAGTGPASSPVRGSR